MPVITISREYGAGGLRVGHRVAERLGLDFFDAALIEETARRLRVPEEAVRRWDERGEGLFLRLLRALYAAHPEYASGSAWPDAEGGAADPDQIGRVYREIIEEAGRSGNAVIVGRGGAFILPAGAEVHHFRIVAPRPLRIQWLRQEGRSEEELAAVLDRVDRERLAYIRRQFGVDARDAAHYCLIVNTGCLSLERTAELLIDVVGGGRSGAPDNPAGGGGPGADPGATTGAGPGEGPGSAGGTSAGGTIRA